MIFQVEGWEDREGNRHTGEPTDLNDTYGLFVHVINPDDSNYFRSPEHQHEYFWAYTGGPFKAWNEWYVYIGALMDMYGVELA